MNGLTLVLGLIDLFAVDPVCLRYEAVATNLATGVFFMVGALGAKPLVQPMAELRQGQAFEPGRPELQAFFRLFTLALAASFCGKAALYLWLARTVPLSAPWRCVP